jgi:hypothetical protein
LKTVRAIWVNGIERRWRMLIESPGLLELLAVGATKGRPWSLCLPAPIPPTGWTAGADARPDKPAHKTTPNG